MSVETESGLTLAELNKIIQHNLAPPDEAIPTGEYHVTDNGDRYPVYKEVREITKAQPQRDPEGHILYHLRADGSKHRPMMERVVVGHEEREYIIVPVGNGISQKEYHFRPAPGEMERKRREKEDREALTELSRFLREQGKGFPDLLGAIKGAFGSAPAKGGKTKQSEAE